MMVVIFIKISINKSIINNNHLLEQIIEILKIKEEEITIPLTPIPNNMYNNEKY